MRLFTHKAIVLDLSQQLLNDMLPLFGRCIPNRAGEQRRFVDPIWSGEAVSSMIVLALHSNKANFLKGKGYLS